MGRGHGFVLKLDENFNPSTNASFGNETLTMQNANGSSTLIDFYLDINSSDYHKTNNIYDIKEISNGNIAFVINQNCAGCRSSGANIGVGKLIAYDNNFQSPVFETVLNESRGGLIGAFDMKIGFSSTTNDKINLITTINEGQISDNPSDILSLENSYTAITNQTNYTFQAGVNSNVLITETNYHINESVTGTYMDVANTSALISSYDFNGNLIWDKIVDSDDNDIQVYPGDWKEQECVYQIIEGSAGELVFVGNTSHNKDDYFIGKIAGDCNLTTDYDVRPANGETTFDINANTTWNPAAFGGQTEIDVLGDIRIKDGATLTIENLTVRFADTRKAEMVTRLVVERRADLRVINSHLRANACAESMWDGIQVYGQSNLSQTVSNQGKIRARNSVFEDAVIAVALVKREGFDKDLAYTGGIADIENCDFFNNLISVEFRTYQNILPNGNIVNNVSRLVDNQFIINDLMNDPGYAYIAEKEKVYPRAQLASVYAFGIRGVSILGNKFEVQSDLFTDSRKGVGILSVDGQCNVLAKCNDASIPVNGSCTNKLPNEFRNLWIGIDVKPIKNVVDMRINDNVFDDNHIGVAFEGLANFSEIRRNKFLIADRSTKFTSFSNVGIWTKDASSLLIDDNEFENINESLDVTSMGIYVRNSNNNTMSDIYRNEFLNLDIGLQSVQDNKDLEVDCNTFNHGDNSLLDWHNFSGQLSDQGECTPDNNLVPILNRFQGNYTNGNGEFGILNNSSVFSYSGYVTEYPTSSQNVFLTDPCITNSSSFSEACPNQVTNGNIELQEEKIQQLKTTYNSLNAEIDNGLTDYLIELINAGDNELVLNSLVNSSPYLSDFVLVSLVNNSAISSYVKNEVLLANAPLSTSVLKRVLNSNLDGWVVNNALVQSSPFDEQIIIEALKSDSPIANWIMKNVLIENSPLTDGCLAVVLENDNDMANWVIKDVALMNTPLSENMQSMLVQENYPLWVRNAIANSNYMADSPGSKEFVQSVITTLITSLNSAKRDLQREVNTSVRLYLKDGNFNSAISLLEEYNDIWASCALLPLYAEKSDYNKVNEHVAKIRDAAARESYVDNASQKSSQLTQYCDLYEKIAQLYENNLSLDNISTSSITELEEITSDNASVLLNYENILGYVKDNFIVDLKVQDFSISKNKRAVQNSETTIESVEHISALKVYPNPATSMLTIEYDLLPNMKTLRIIDLTGKICKRIDLDNDSNITAVDISEVKEGMYILSLSSDNSVETIKLLIKR